MPGGSFPMTMIDAVASSLYTLSPRTTPRLVLKRLGIATPWRRPEFYTLDDLLRSLHPVTGAILECGVYRGATLLGMAHVLNTRGMRPRIYGLDSFQGFPEPTAEDAQDGKLHPSVHRGALGDTSPEALR